jgi:hypothetical protein
MEASTNKRRCTRTRLVHFPWDISAVVATHTRTQNAVWSTSNAFQYDGSPTWSYELLLLHPRGFSACVFCVQAHVTRDVGFVTISQWTERSKRRLKCVLINTCLCVCVYVCIYTGRATSPYVCMYTGWATSPYSPVQEWCCAVLAEGSSHIQKTSDNICNVWHGSVGAILNTYSTSRHCTFTVTPLWPYFWRYSVLPLRLKFQTSIL